MTALLLTLLVIGSAACWRQHDRNAQRRHHLTQLQAGMVEPETGLASEAAIPMRLLPELAWAKALGARVAIIVVHPYGTAATRIQGTAAMRGVMRGYENAFRIDDRDIVIELWDTDHHAAVVAAGRLLDALAAGGCRCGDAGIAIYPDDGTELDALVATARERMQPAQELLAYAQAWRGRPAPEQPPVPSVLRAA